MKPEDPNRFWKQTLSLSARRLAKTREREQRSYTEHVAVILEARNAGLTLSQIADYTGVTKVRISQILKKHGTNEQQTPVV